MGDPVRSVPRNPPATITGRERPRLPTDGFLDRLRPRDPRVALYRLLGHRVLTGTPLILPLVHVPAEVVAPAAHDRATPGQPALPALPARLPPLPARLSPLRSASPPDSGLPERPVPSAAPAPVIPGPRPASPPGVTTNPGSKGGPEAPEEPRVRPQRWDDPRTPTAPPASSRPAIPKSPASPTAPASPSRPAGLAGRAGGASAVGTAWAEGVPVVRGRAAEEHASLHAARATSTADAIHLPDRHGPPGTPEADALLAHELVHVRARRRAPGANVGTPTARAAEERVAHAVESEVRQGRRPAPRAASRAPATPPGLLAPAAQPLAPLGGSQEPVAGDPALSPPRDPDPSSAVRTSDADAAVSSGPPQWSNRGPGSSFLAEVSRAPEPPATAAPSPDEERQLDRLARLLAERLQHELAAGRERGGGVLDLSRW